MTNVTHSDIASASAMSPAVALLLVASTAVSIKDDTGWSTTTDAASRLAWARKASGYTQDTFAEAVGFKRGAYRKYESGETPLRYEQARPWARKLKIRWEWLLDGKLLPFPDQEEAEPGPLDRVAEVLEGRPLEEQQEMVAAFVALAKRRA